VTIGGVPCADLDRSALAELRVLIPQEAYVFTGSVWENITYLHGSASLAEVDAAIDRYELRSFLEGLGGYEAEINPRQLSAGEKQLIALIRASLASAPILIFDEATCHLDPRTEARLE